MFEAPNILILKDRPKCACLQTALSKLVVEVLQRRFDALLQAGTLRLKTTYLVAGLITTTNECRQIVGLFTTGNTGWMPSIIDKGVKP